MSTYKNGNYIVSIHDNGTKIFTALRRGEEFNPDFPDSIDIKLTDRCGRGCPYCHENSTIKGKHGDLIEMIVILGKLPPVPIELSFGGGNLFEMNSSELINFLKWCKDRGHRTGITINYSYFYKIIDNPKFIGVIDAIGVSLDLEFQQESIEYSISQLNSQLYCWYGKTSGFIPIVFHLVLGTFSLEFLKEFISNFDYSPLGNGNVVDVEWKRKRILFLGYKTKGRGLEVKDKFYPSEKYLQDLRKIIFEDGMDRIMMGDLSISFDNLAIQQLNLRSAFTTEEWDGLYQGDDFTHSMYIDLPGRCYGPSSTSDVRVSFDDPIYGNDIVKYFKNEHN